MKAVAVALGALFAFLPSGFAVVGEDALPKAEWLSHSAAVGAQTAFFRKSFTAPVGLVKAVLLGACDQRMSVFINGEPVGEIAGFVQGSSVDVTRYIRPDRNVIALRAVNEKGSAAVRALLELASDRGRQSWVASDATWSASLAEQPGWERAEFSAETWTPAHAHGEDGVKQWGNTFDATKSVDAYNSWMLARGSAEATDPATISAPPGFKVELLRSSQPGEDSWIALAFDPQGRLTVAREKRGLLRFTLGADRVEKVEVAEDTLLECRGLLYAHGALYVNANNSKGFYRLRDTDGDGNFEEKKLLLETPGGVGHGRNQLRLGPDGLIYLVHGNDVVAPPNVAPDSPLRNYASDVLFPEKWGEHGATEFVKPPHGHVLATDAEGTSWKLMAGGLRNALDIDFNEDGEMFTYDADNERDLAAPWYKPTRVLHVVPGGDYGWRPGAGKWPAYLPDTLPSVVDIGIGSPCGIEFGTRSNFSEKWRRALFIADWAYGRIIAVHLHPRGASYSGETEPFLSGRPLNVTDMTFGSDGAMYFITGGRGTRSGLYRVSHRPGRAGVPRELSTPPQSQTVRDLVRSFGGSPNETGGSPVLPGGFWPRLGDADHFVRYAARVALERQPLADWKERAFAESDPTTLLTALLAIARVGDKVEQPRLFARLEELGLDTLSDEHRLAAVRVLEVSCVRMGAPLPSTVASIPLQLDLIYPARDARLNHELCRLLVFLRAPGVVEKTTRLLAAARTPADLLHYLFHLRHVPDGWTLEQRRMAFSALQRAEALQGARDYLDALRVVRRDFTRALDAGETDALGTMLQPAPKVRTSPAVDPAEYQFTKAWALPDFTAADLAMRGSPDEGRKAFAAAQCMQCHRAAGEGGGNFGPDLTGVAARFGGRELLAHILEPSAFIDEKFRNTIVTMKDGSLFSGLVEEEDEGRIVLSIGPGESEPLEIPTSKVATRTPSEQSPMPPGLLNVLSKQQIIDLLTYLAP